MFARWGTHIKSCLFGKRVAIDPAMRRAIASKMEGEGMNSRARLGVVAIVVCTFVLWLILGGGAEVARLIAGGAVALAAGAWAPLDTA
ncbi:MAG TPA: hypothetical protein VGP48_08255 [Stellaceae bacterium]|jgi:hypothetical protein|nr:hypothetical protein [Stellaceae bacterium]